MLTMDSNAPMPSKSKLPIQTIFNSTPQSSATKSHHGLNGIRINKWNKYALYYKSLSIILNTNFLCTIPTTNTMHNLATWMTYKMYQSYILGISFKPEFYKSGLSLPGMFANIWIGQRDFELTSPNSLFQISISWYHRQVHRKTLYTGLRRQTKAQGTHPFSKAGLTGAQVARLFIGAPDKRGQEF